MIWMLSDYQLGAEATTYAECVASNVAAGQSRVTAESACAAAGPWPDPPTAGNWLQQMRVGTGSPGSFTMSSMTGALVGLAVIGVVYYAAKKLWRKR